MFYLTAKKVTVSLNLHNYKHKKLIIKKIYLKNTNLEVYNLYIFTTIFHLCQCITAFMIYSTFYLHNCSFQLKLLDTLDNVTPGRAETCTRQIVDSGYSPEKFICSFHYQVFTRKHSDRQYCKILLIKVNNTFIYEHKLMMMIWKVTTC